MAASSTARFFTISGVTVPRPAEFSVKAPSFNGFVFISKKLSCVWKRLRVVRRFHFAHAAILRFVAGLREHLVPLFGFGRGCFGIGPQPVYGLRENRRLRDGRNFGAGLFVFHGKSITPPLYKCHGVKPYQ